VKPGVDVKYWYTLVPLMGVTVTGGTSQGPFTVSVPALTPFCGGGAPGHE
jgi:hypothetical protein